MEEKPHEPPKAAKIPEAAAPTGEEPTKTKKGTFMFLTDQLPSLFGSLSSESVYVLVFLTCSIIVEIIFFKYTLIHVSH